MPFPPKVKEDALIACGRHCCICHKFCGTKIEVHHIHPEAKGGDDSLDNAIPLCFDCHADMVSYDKDHPKGTKYTESELKRHRDSWNKKVEGNIGLATRQEVLETDTQVYLLLTKILPWDGSVQFIRENNFAGFSFELKRLNDFYAFDYQCDNPSFEFLDPDLEGLRKQLLIAIRAFGKITAYETFPTHNPGWNSVPQDWEIEQPERFEETVKKLHSEAGKVCNIYDTLIRTATRKLGVIPNK
jgi:hypothetical protein